MAKKGILVTRGTGLVGAYSVAMLAERGERPIAFDVALNERLLNAVGINTSAVRLIRREILDLPGFISALRDNDIDPIIHWRLRLRITGIP